MINTRDVILVVALGVLATAILASKAMGIVVFAIVTLETRHTIAVIGVVAIETSSIVLARLTIALVYTASQQLRFPPSIHQFCVHDS